MGERDAQLLAGEAGIAVAQPDRHEVGVPLPQAHVADLRGHDGAVQPGWGVEDEGVHPEGPPREAGHVAPPWVDGGATRQPLRKVGDHAGRWFGGVDEGCLAERRAGHVIHGPAVGQTDGDLVVGRHHEPGAAGEADAEWIGSGDGCVCVVVVITQPS